MTGRRVSHYLLERLLGTGGMGEVFLARDLALGRLAALKLLPAGFDLALRDRLLQEARFCARLQHPAIATFYEAGEANGVTFIAMEYVPGETLRQRLRAGALPPPQALGIVASVLEGLAHAHAAGILHRDIKPENIMVTADRLGRLLDFGVAKRLAQEGWGHSQEQTVLTETGAVVGTPGYLSPEQARGGVVDERSDVFGVGAVLFEALSGRRAFPGASFHEQLAALLSADVPPLEPQGAPPGIDAVLRRALARIPSERYPSASAFLRELQDVVSGVRVSATPDTLAVVDLENVSADPADAWIGSAVAEQLTGDLAHIPALQVVARERVLRSRASLTTSGATPDALEIARLLGCRWLLSGSFQRMGRALRFTTRLTEVPTSRVVASERLDGTLEGIFAMQDRLAEAVARGLPLDLRGVAKRTSITPHVNAYELYATGQRLFHRLEKGTFADAMRMFERAIEADPRFAPPYGGLAAVHAMHFTYMTDPRFAPPYGGLAAVHAMHFTYMTDPRELEVAEGYGRRAIELDPTLGAPHIWLGYTCWRRGRIAEALTEFEQARQLVPDSAYGHYFAGCTLWSVWRDEEALAHLQQAVQVDRQHGFAWLMLGLLLGDLERLDEAEWCLVQAVAVEGQPGPGPTIGASGMLAEILRRQGHLARARQASMEGIAATERSDHMYRDSFRVIDLVVLGRIALDQGDRDAARAAFSQAAAHVRGRPRTLGGRRLLAQALAGLAVAGDDKEAFTEGIQVLEHGDAYDASWLWRATEHEALDALAEAAAAHGRADLADALRARARDECRARG